MRMHKNVLWCLTGLVPALCVPAHATVQISSVRATPRAPQLIGTSIAWTVTATDSNPGPLAFQFNVATPNGQLILAKDFNLGTLSSGTWTSPTFTWVPTGIEGTYKVQVVVKDFTSGESASKTGSYQVNPLVTGSAPVVTTTGNPLVALFSAPSCASGSSMRIAFHQQGNTTLSNTNWVKCHPPNTMTFEVAGMYASTTYYMYSQTRTSTGKITKGSTLSFTTGPLPTNLTFPTFTVKVPPGSQADTTDSMILMNPDRLGGQPERPNVATDLSGNIMWYYNGSVPQCMTRPIPGGGIQAIETGAAWNPASGDKQLFQQIDLAGNIVRETNTGAIQQQLLALGATNGGPCNIF
jgi:hypothetical protein